MTPDLCWGSFNQFGISAQFHIKCHQDKLFKAIQFYPHCLLGILVNSTHIERAFTDLWDLREVAFKVFFNKFLENIQ